MPRIIDFEGRRIEVPDDFTDDDISVVLQGSSGPSPAAAPSAPSAPAPALPVEQDSAPPRPEYFSKPVAEPAPEVGSYLSNPIDMVRGIFDRVMAPEGQRGLTIGSQSVGRGVADLVGLPGDLANSGANLALAGADKASQLVGGPELPFRFGESPVGSKGLSDLASGAAEAAGVPLVERADMAPRERVQYDLQRGGTAGVVGAGGLTAAAPRVAANMRGAPSLADAFLEPYKAAAARTWAGDAAGGAGAQLAASSTDDAAEQLPPGLMRDVFKAIAPVIAPILGGTGGVLASEGLFGLGSALRSSVMKRSLDTEVGRDPLTGRSFNRSETEDAARRYQDEAKREALTEAQAEALPSQARRQIEESANEIRAADLPMPSTAMLTDNVGLGGLETRQRMDNRAPFIAKDNQVRQGAAERVQSIREPDADPALARQVAQQEVDARMGAARQSEADAAAAARAAQEAQAAEGAAVAPLANERAQNEASRRLYDETIERGYVPARTEKNRQFDQAPGRAEQLPADDVVAAAQRVRQSINELGPAREQLPAEFVQRLERLAPDIRERTTTSPILDASGNPISRTDTVNVGGPGTASGEDLADLRKYLNDAQSAAQKGGNFALADNIGQLRAAVNRTIENAPGYADANANYRRFADTYRPSRGDEAAKFTREIDRGQEPAPSKMAERFLAGSEKTAALKRLVDAAPNPGSGRQAVRDKLIGEMAAVGLNHTDGTLNWRAVSKWRQQNADAIAAFPQVGKEVDDIVARAQSGAKLSADMQDRLKQAQRAVGETQRAVDKSAAGFMIDGNIEDAARGVLDAKKNRVERVRDINKVLAGNKKAREGWQAAVSDAVADRVTQNAPVTSDAKEVGVSFANLAKELKRNEDVLAEVYKDAPEKLKALQDVRSLLGRFQNLAKNALPGSQTAERGFMDKVEVAVRLHYGALHGGSIMRKIRIIAAALPNNAQTVNRLMAMASTDPDVAMYLLGRKVRNFDAPAANKRLQQMLGLGAMSRSNDDDAGDSK